MEFAIKNPRMYSQSAVEEDTLRNGEEMSLKRELERPSWTSNGTLRKKPPKKHYIAKHPFYYSAQELFENQPVEEPRMKSEEVRDYLKSLRRPSDKDVVRRAFSAPQDRVAKKKKEEEITTGPQFVCPSRVISKKGVPVMKSGLETGPEPPLEPAATPALSRPRESPPTLKSGTYSKSFPDSIPWHLTGIPGIRVLQEHDHYRRKALDMKNTDIFHIKSGVIPKYLGYVPGLKFRHGGTYGRMTYNAREIGVEISPTWGGAVSLLFR